MFSANRQSRRCSTARNQLERRGSQYYDEIATITLIWTPTPTNLRTYSDGLPFMKPDWWNLASGGDELRCQYYAADPLYVTALL